MREETAMMLRLREQLQADLEEAYKWKGDWSNGYFEALWDILMKLDRIVEGKYPQLSPSLPIPM